MASANVSDNSHPTQSISTWGVVVGLVSLHYGMGFILGTGEQAYLYGVSGAVYAVAAGLGLLGLSLLAGFYWRTKEPIWDLLGDRYGEVIRHFTNLLSWVWMIGVMAGQVLGAGYALSILGVPANAAIVILGLAIAVLGPIPLKRITWLFATFLVISTLALIVSLWQLGGISLYWQSISAFPSTIQMDSLPRIVGTIAPTLFLTLIGMDFHQVLVTGRRGLNATLGALIAGSILLLVSFLPASVVLGGMQNGIISPGTINGKDAIPTILATLGSDIFSGGGLFLVAGLIVVAIGSGSGLNRALIRSFQAAPFMPKMLNNPIIAAWINAGIALGIALTGFTIIGLVVSFYAIYVAGVFVPFIAYLLERRYGVRFASRSIIQAAWVGGGTAALIFITSLIGRTINVPALSWAVNTPEVWMLFTGMFMAAVTLWGTHMWANRNYGLK